MTRYNAEQIEEMSRQIRGGVIETLEYDSEGDYFTLTFEGGMEFSFRFMADLISAARPPAPGETDGE